MASRFFLLAKGGTLFRPWRAKVEDSPAGRVLRVEAVQAEGQADLLPRLVGDGEGFVAGPLRLYVLGELAKVRLFVVEVPDRARLVHLPFSLEVGAVEPLLETVVIRVLSVQATDFSSGDLGLPEQVRAAALAYQPLAVASSRPSRRPSRGTLPQCPALVQGAVLPWLWTPRVRSLGGPGPKEAFPRCSCSAPALGLGAAWALWFLSSGGGCPASLDRPAALGVLGVVWGGGFGRTSQPMAERIRVVTGSLVRGGRILLSQRTPTTLNFPLLWEVPGGRVEKGESDQEALAREFLEEVGLRVRVSPAPFFQEEFDPPLLSDPFLMVQYEVFLLGENQSPRLLDAVGVGWFEMPLPVGLPTVPSLIKGVPALCDSLREEGNEYGFAR